MECSMCPIAKACTVGEYTGKCPEPKSVSLYRGKWWANYGENGPFKTKREAEEYEQNN